jgi:copper chaperone CopZ
MTDQKNAGSCCSADGFCHSAAPDAQGSGVTTVYMVSGMTCGHCEGAVSLEISALDGVTTVKAVAETGEVIVTSVAPLDEEAVRAAVDEADFGKHPGAGARAESWKAGNDLCAVRRFVVSPTQLGGTQRNVLGSPGLPGRESARGQSHARKAVVTWRRSG